MDGGLLSFGDYVTLLWVHNNSTGTTLRCKTGCSIRYASAECDLILFTVKAPCSNIGVSEPDPPPEKGLACVLGVLGFVKKRNFSQIYVFSSSAN